MAIKLFSVMARAGCRVQAGMMGPQDMLSTVHTGVVHAPSNVWVRGGQPASEGLLDAVADRLSQYVATAPLADSLNMVTWMDDKAQVRCACGVLARLPDLRDQLTSRTARRIAHVIATDGRSLDVQISAAMYLVGELTSLGLEEKVGIVVMAQRIAEALRAANRAGEADTLLHYLPAQLLVEVAELSSNPNSALSAALASDGAGPMPLPDDGRRRFV